MTIFAIAGLSVAISCAILAVIALLFGRTPMQRLLVYFNIACALWGFGSFLASIARSDADGILAWRIANSGGFFLGPLFYHFVILFTKSGQRKLLYCAYIQAAVCTLAGLSSKLLFNNTRYVFGAFYNVVTPLYLVCIGIYLFLVFLSYYKLIKFRMATKGYRRTQADYIIFGFSFGFLGGTSTFLPFFHVDFLYPFGNFGIVIYSAILCYAILHHRIIDFHLAVRKSITYFLSIGLLYGIFILSVFTFTKVVSRFMYMSSSASTIVSTLLVAVLFTPLRNKVQQFASRVFFRPSYNYTTLVRETGRELASSIDLQKTYRLFTDTFLDNFKLKNACLLALREGYFETAYSVGNAMPLSQEEAESPSPETSSRGKLLASSSFLALLARQGGIIIKDNLFLLDDQINGEAVVEELQIYNGELAAPVFVDKQLVFLLILGEKFSGDPFTSEDIDLVTTITSQASLALKNAQLYDELSVRLDEIIHYQKSLAEQKERLAVTLTSIGDAVIATDTEGKVMLFNRVAEELTGWSQDEVEGKLLSKTVTILEETTREESCNTVNTIFNDGELTGHITNALLVARDGVERIVEISGAPIKDQDEKIIGDVLAFRDVSEKRRIENELLNARKLESIAILAAGIAHEINNPLTNASLNIELLLEKLRAVRLDTEDIQRLEKIEKNVDRAAVIARDLLHFSRQRDFEFKPVDVNEIIRNSIAQLEYKFKNTAIYLDLHSVLPVLGDMARLEQAFINLINNSIESMTQKGELQITSKNINGYLELTFRDTGAGIPPEVTEKVFDPFFTTKEIGEGTGLGLAICYGIIKKHQGSIELSSELGKGTVVTVKLPQRNIL